MDINKIKNFIKKGNTLLGIGPVSKNCVDAAIEIANEYDFPVMLIASRRQIDSEKIACGYVNNWSTREFIKYVRKKQKKDNLILARDHGGQWQNNIETERKLNFKEATESAKLSFTEDIDAGMDIIHIDPSIDIYEQISFDKIFERFAQLYLYCSDYAKKTEKNVEFETGTEEQNIFLNTPEHFSMVLNQISSFCRENNLKNPLFTVTQIGTKVMETKNIGILNNPNNSNLILSIKNLCSCAMNQNYLIKIHNADYLNKDVISLFPKLKISSANIAPEFGVCETKSFLNLTEKYNLPDIKNEFLSLSYKSEKWRKWIMTEAITSDEEKAIIAGHYIFSTDEFLKLKDQAQKRLKQIDIDQILKNDVKEKILYYINILYKSETIQKDNICKIL